METQQPLKKAWLYVKNVLLKIWKKLRSLFLFPGKLWFYIKYSVLLLFQVALLSVIIYRVIPVPITWTVVEQWRGFDKDWVPYKKISKNVVIAAMTSEDPNFNTHWGFEFKAIKEAYEDNYDEDNKNK